MTVIKTSVRDRVALVTLSDPKRRNAISLEMSAVIASTFDQDPQKEGIPPCHTS